MTALEILLVLGIGLAGGISGGLLGIGGSVVMLPLLTLLLGPNQQLYQAACMPVNVVVAIGALRRHVLAKTIRTDWLRWLMPATALAAIVGVLLGNLLDGAVLGRLFGAFLLYVAASEALRHVRRVVVDCAEITPATPGGASLVGAATGGIAGLLGVGGGIVAVPLLRTIGRMPLRQAIATSTATIVIASSIGAIAKNASIGSLTGAEGEPLSLGVSLGLAAILAPSALLGGYLGSRLTYALPIAAVRIAFAVLIGIAGLRMIGLVPF
jgi:uncharacterized membrane protein YfcA